jgi:hypothetical protein
MIGAGDDIDATLANPGLVRTRLHPPSGRGSRHETVVQVADAFGTHERSAPGSS